MNVVNEAMVVVLFLGVFFIGMLTSYKIDTDKDMNLDAITKMTEKCDNNGGIESITHSYDVTCKNGANFPFKE